MTARDEFRMRQHCMACGRSGAWDVHEIASGPARHKAIKEPCAWLLLCRPCHNEMHDRTIWSITRQLALKKKMDPDNYDRIRVNELRGRHPEAITEEEVDAYKEGLE